MGFRGPALAYMGPRWHTCKAVGSINRIKKETKKKHTWGSRRVASRAPLAAASLLWLLWAVAGPRWPALAVVGFREPALAVVGFRGPAFAVGTPAIGRVNRIKKETEKETYLGLETCRVSSPPAAARLGWLSWAVLGLRWLLCVFVGLCWAALAFVGSTCR